MEYLCSPSVSETGIRSTLNPKNAESVLWLMSTEAAPTLEQGHKDCRLKDCPIGALQRWVPSTGMMRDLQK